MHDTFLFHFIAMKEKQGFTEDEAVDSGYYK